MVCRGCGARNTADRAMRDAGWYRCSYCGSCNALEPAHADVYEGPASRLVVLRRLSRHQLIIPRGTLMSRGQLLLAWFMTIMITGMFTAPMELEAPGDWRWLGPLLVALPAFFLMRWFYLRYRTEQQVDVSHLRVRGFHVLGGRSIARIDESLAGGELAIERVAPTGGERRDLILTAPSGARLRLAVRGDAEAHWTEMLLRQAVDPSFRESELSCRGCGARLGVDLVDRADGFINCPYCSAGLLLGRGQTELAPARLPALPAAAGAPPAGVADDGDGSLRLIGYRGIGQLIMAAGVLYGIGMFGAGAGFLLSLLDATPAGTVALKIYMICGAVLFGAIALLFLYAGARSLFGQHRIAITDHYLAIRDIARIGSRTLEPPLVLHRLAGTFGADYAAPGNTAPPINRVPIASKLLARTGLLNAYRPEYDLRLPAYLIGELRFEHDDAIGATTMIASAAPREIRVMWHLPPAADAWLQRRLAGELRAELEALGREVEPAQSTVPSST